MFWRSLRALVGLVLLCGGLPLAAPVQAAEAIVDNSDGSVQLKGKWTATNTTGGFLGQDYLYRTPGDGSSSVTWPFPGSAGHYDVFARWSAGPNRATNATYQITSNSGSSNVSVNQRINGGAWQLLGSFDFQPNKNQSVSLTDKADGVVVADAIRFVDSSSPAAATAPQPAAAQVTAVSDQVTQAAVPKDARFFQQTGYRIGEDAFWRYFRCAAACAALATRSRTSFCCTA
jgi:hypothetical protein